MSIGGAKKDKQCSSSQSPNSDFEFNDKTEQYEIVRQSSDPFTTKHGEYQNLELEREQNKTKKVKLTETETENKRKELSFFQQPENTYSLVMGGFLGLALLIGTPVPFLSAISPLGGTILSTFVTYFGIVGYRFTKNVANKIESILNRSDNIMMTVDPKVLELLGNLNQTMEKLQKDVNLSIDKNLGVITEETNKTIKKTMKDITDSLNKTIEGTNTTITHSMEEITTNVNASLKESVGKMSGQIIKNVDDVGKTTNASVTKAMTTLQAGGILSLLQGVGRNPNDQNFQNANENMQQQNSNNQNKKRKR